MTITQDSKTIDFYARILNRKYFKFYEDVLLKARKDFPKSYKFISNKISPRDATGSNFFFICLADEMLGKEKRIARLNDWARILNEGNFTEGVYFDTNQLVLYSNQDSYEPNQCLINDLSKKLKGTRIGGAPIIYAPEFPLIITNPKLKNSNSEKNIYKLVLNLDDAEFENNLDFAYGKDKIKLGRFEKELLTKSDGLSRLFLNGDYVRSDEGNLAKSYPYGRVAIFNCRKPEIINFRNY